MKRILLCALALLLLCGCESKKDKEAREKLQQMVREYDQKKQQLNEQLQDIEADERAKRKALWND